MDGIPGSRPEPEVLGYRDVDQQGTADHDGGHVHQQATSQKKIGGEERVAARPPR